MKKFTKLALMGLTSAILIGCGGGSGGGDNPPNPTPTVTGLTEAKVNEFASQVAKEEGCQYNLVNTTTDTTLDMSTVYTVVKAVHKGMQKESLTVTTQETNVPSFPPSDCSNGSVDITVQGTTTIYTFNNYCTTQLIPETEFRANGTATQIKTSKGDQVTVNGDISLQGVNQNTGEVQDVSVSMSNLVIETTVGTATDPEELRAVDVSADQLILTDNTLHDTTTITNLSAHYDAQSGNLTFNTNVTTSDSTVGTLKAEGDINIENGTGNASVTDIFGNTASVVATEEEHVFSVRFNEKELGKMDCSMVENPDLPEE